MAGVEFPEQARRGRPRGFDEDAALEQAMTVFWQYGYQGTSLTALEEAMRISRKSMYAAFGNKQDLFAKVLQRYESAPGGYLAEAVRAPTAREVARSYLSGAVRAVTRSDRPAGCLGVRAALSVGATGEDVRDILAAWRDRRQSELRDRFRRAIDAGDLSDDADPDVIAQYLTTVADGIAVQATGGASAAALQHVVDVTLRHWPPA